MPLNIDKLARECDARNITVLSSPHEAGYPPHFVFSKEQLTTYTRAVMEECAKACHFYDENGEGPDCWDWHSKDYAAAIREMMP